MKLRHLILSVVAAVAVAFDAAAQYTVVETSLNGGTANVSASTTNSVTSPLITVKRAQNVALQSSFKLTGSGTSDVVLTFDSSVDGSTWVSGTHSLSVTAAGTSTVANLTKIDTGGAGYFRLSSVANPNSAAITNLVLKYSYKPGQ